jgi:soluble lytic murein transglycosylase
LSRFSAKLNDSERANAWAQIALQSALKLEPEALAYWVRADGATLSQEAYQWRVRTALREGDWKIVKTTIALMPASLKNEPAWIYWLGRALKAEGKTKKRGSYLPASPIRFISMANSRWKKTVRKSACL